MQTFDKKRGRLLSVRNEPNDNKSKIVAKANSYDHPFDDNNRIELKSKKQWSNIYNVYEDILI